MGAMYQLPAASYSARCPALLCLFSSLLFVALFVFPISFWLTFPPVNESFLLHLSLTVLNSFLYLPVCTLLFHHSIFLAL